MDKNAASPVSSDDSPIDDIHGFRGLPIPPLLPDIPADMAQPIPLNPAQYQVPVEKFGGEDDEDVEEFLDSLELVLPGETQIPDEAKTERARVATLHRHLTGQAKDSWKTLGPSNKATYELAAAALKRRFPKPDEESEYRSAQNRAIVEMNTLTQGEKTTEEYVKKTISLYGILGEENALTLATKFVDGISNPMVQALVDTQTKGSYTPFMDVINAFKISTTTIRRQELASQARSHSMNDKKPPKQDYQQMVYHMSELFKGILSSQPDRQDTTTGQTALQERGLALQREQNGYQPIVGTIQQQHYQQGPATSKSPTTPSYPGQSQQQGARSTYQSYQSNYQRGRGARSDIVCFRCGIQGHRVYDCLNPPLPREEQDRLRNQDRSRYESSRIAGSNVTTQQPQMVTCVEVPDEDEGTDPTGMVMMSTNLVDIMVEEQEQAVLHRLKSGAYSAEDVAYLVAMAEKRSRTDDVLAKSAPPGRRLRTETGDSAPIHESITVSPSQGQQSQTSQPKPASVTPSQPTVAHEGQPFVPDPYYEDPAHHSQFIPTASVPKSKIRKGKEPKPKRHIKMMKGLKEWDPVEALRTVPVVGLDFGNLIDQSPAIRMKLCKSLQLEADPTKRPKAWVRAQRTPVEVQAISETSAVKPRIPGVRKDGILPEPKVRFFNFHTYGTIVDNACAGSEREQGVRVDKILIDGGAVVNLMPETIARNLGLCLMENRDILIRTATNEIRPVQYYTEFTIAVAGVVAKVTVYVINIPQSYSLLLGRKWLYQVRARGDYERQTYTIYDGEGFPHPVISLRPEMEGVKFPRGGLQRRDNLPQVLINPHGDGELLTDLEKDEIIAGEEKVQNVIEDLIAEAVLDARAQSLEQGVDSDDNTEEGYDTESDEEIDADADDVYEYPGSGDEMGNDWYHHPKGVQQ